MQAKRIVIPGFESLTKQQMFDISSAHILKTRTRCVNDRGACTYSGPGCAAAPFLTKEAAQGVYGSWIKMVSRKEVPEHEAVFVAELQGAHDGANPINFMQEWKYEMKKLATEYDLSPHLIDADKE